MKRLLLSSVSAAAIVMTGMSASSATAAELVIKPVYEVHTFKCSDKISFDQFILYPYPVGNGSAKGCPERQNGRYPKRHEESWEGYAVEKTKEDRCGDNRIANLLLNGDFYESRELGEFQADGALFSYWKNPRPTPAETQGYWPPGQYEVVLPAVTYHAKVFNADEEQDEAKSLLAKIICQKVTLKLGAATNEYSE